jgi:hypothetical protein
MTQSLKDILKQAHDRIKGVHASQTTAGSTGKDPGVDYAPKAGDEDEFVAKHSVEKWDDPQATDDQRHGGTKYSLDDMKNQRLGNTQEKSKKDYFVPVKEAKESEEAKCNMTVEGKMCPVHGMNECSSMKPIKEDKWIQKAIKKPGALHKQLGVPEDEKIPAGKLKAAADKGGKLGQRARLAMTLKKMHKEEAIDEVITKKTPAGEVISDFVHSKNPKFAGKSKEERKRMALGAYYSMHKEKSRKEVKEWAVQPLLGSTDIAKNKTDDTESEIEMVRTELKAIANKVMHLLANMPADHHIEPWVQAKIAQSKEMIGAVHDYMMYSEHEPEEKETMDTPMTFPNMNVDVNTGVNV